MDAAYYSFPSEAYLAALAAQVPADFRFTFKVTDDITLKHFPNLARFGRRAGQPNQHFLDADLFERAFLRPCGTLLPKVGMLAALDKFLSRIPPDWCYGVELRNRHWLVPEYFAMLASHVAHVFNSWADMPVVSEQMALPGSVTNPQLVGARFLLKPGRKYQEAVDLFSPYNRS